MQENTQDKLFHDDDEVGAIDSAGQVHDVQNQQGIELIVEAFPFYLRNALRLKQKAEDRNSKKTATDKADR